MRLSRHDVRLAARSFTRHRTFSIVAVVSLGLAIALNTTMYSVIDAMVNPHTDIAHAERVHPIVMWGDSRHAVDARKRAELLRSGDRIFEEMTSFGPASNHPVSLEHGRNYEQASVAYVAPNVFRALGIRPSQGRPFTDDDYTAASAPVVLSARAANTLFPDGESPIGAVVDLDGSPHPVIGVVGKASQPGVHYDVWMLPPATVPLAAIFPNIVRVRAGLSREQINAEVERMSVRFAELAGENPKYTRLELSGLKPAPFSFRRFHYALVSAVVAVLLIACANLANLQLARGLGRSRELALRTALGATRRDIVNQLLLESALLAAVGLVLGLVLTLWANGLLAAHIPQSVAEYIIEPQISWRVFAFALAACLVCVTIIGLIPALHVSRVDPNELLKAGAGTGANTRNRRKYSFMIVAEIGLSLALLSGMALLIRSAAAVQAVNLGYNLKPLAQAFLINRTPGSPVVRYVDVQNALISRVRAFPDVADAAVVVHRRMVDNSTTVADVGGEKRELMTPTYSYSIVSPGYFRTLQLPIVAGRDFSEGVTADGELIIDESTARYLWPNGHAVGGFIKLGSDTSHAPWIRVVGVVKRTTELTPWTFAVVGDAMGRGLGAMYYRPSAQESFVSATFGYRVDVVVRALRDPERMPITLRRELANAAPYELFGSASLEEVVGLRRMRESHDFVARMFVLFTGLAVGLAAVGIYGIVAHSVAERRRELGVRIALGANARDILRAVLREGNAVALGGLAAGLLLTKYTVLWLRAFSLEGDQYDAPLFAAMAAVLFVVAVIAALGPALRATRIDPVESLRSE
ncbi:MAG: FtsX-like permease family protein [bacterium]